MEKTKNYPESQHIDYSPNISPVNAKYIVKTSNAYKEDIGYDILRKTSLNLGWKNAKLLADIAMLYLVIGKIKIYMEIIKYYKGRRKFYC